MTNNFLQMVPVTDILPNPKQPRRIFREDELTALTESISTYGVITPITVSAAGDKYELIAGQRRLLAATIAGCEMIPAMVTPPITPAKSLLLALTENTQRADLNPIDEAEAYKTLMEDITRRGDPIGIESLARMVNKPYERVRGLLKMLTLEPEILTLIRDEKLPYNFRVIEALLRVPPAARVLLVDRCHKENLSGRGIERAVGIYLAYTEKKDPPPDVMEDVIDAGKSIKRADEISKKLTHRRIGRPKTRLTTAKAPNVLIAAFGDYRVKMYKDPGGNIKAMAVKTCLTCPFAGYKVDRENEADPCMECPLTRFMVKYNDYGNPADN